MARSPVIEIYSSPFCGYCHQAKKLIEAKGLHYQAWDVLAEPARQEEMIQRSGGRHSLPQIFINGQHIGGFTELKALIDRGELSQIGEE